jgi:hypothetical protein
MGEIVSLRLDRMLNIEVLKEKFEIREEYDDRRYSSFMEKEPYKARIKFSKAPDSIDLTGFEVKSLGDNVFQIEFFNITEFVNQIIAIDYWEEIMSPKWLVEKIEKKCTQIMEKMHISR